MKKIINYIFWPAVAGLVFAVILLQMPRVVTLFPGLSAYFPAVATQQTLPSKTLIDSYNDAVKSAIQKAAPTVVSINAPQIKQRTELYYDSIYSRVPAGFLSFQDDANSLGSGVIISSDGYIITSFHILFPPGTERLQGKPSTMVTLSDGRNLEARPVILDEANDLALLKINADNLPYIVSVSTNYPEVGDSVLAIGNPRNIGQSVSKGIISALLSREDSYLIQTDAAINPGNSGGALIDLEGNLIGINSTIISESGGSEGIGLAIPAHKAIELLQIYLANGPSGYLGVNSRPLTAEDGLKEFDQPVQGVLITDVVENSPAEKAGIQINDIIMAANGNKFMVSEGKDLLNAGNLIASHGPEATVILDIFRNPNFLQIPVTLGVGEPAAYFDLILSESEYLEASP